VRQFVLHDTLDPLEGGGGDIQPDGNHERQARANVAGANLCGGDFA
jgi:hypothetical protein